MVGSHLKVSITQPAALYYPKKDKKNISWFVDTVKGVWTSKEDEMKLKARNGGAGAGETRRVDAAKLAGDSLGPF